MVGSNKILTVSYGTFSCTLEGFDDSFHSMKAIAEYFRDLAQEDRYFGAEPPTPDAEMLARIAEREISRRVEAEMDDRGIRLRAAAPQAALDAAIGAGAAADAPEQAAPASVEDATTDAVSDVMMPPAVEAPVADASDADDFMTAPSAEAATPTPVDFTPAEPGSFAAKLQRIRSVVGTPAQAAEDADDFEEAVAMPFDDDLDVATTDDAFEADAEDLAEDILSTGPDADILTDDSDAAEEDESDADVADAINLDAAEDNSLTVDDAPEATDETDTEANADAIEDAVEATADSDTDNLAPAEDAVVPSDEEDAAWAMSALADTDEVEEDPLTAETDDADAEDLSFDMNDIDLEQVAAQATDTDDGVDAGEVEAETTQKSQSRIVRITKDGPTEVVSGDDQDDADANVTATLKADTAEDAYEDESDVADAGEPLVLDEAFAESASDDDADAEAEVEAESAELTDVAVLEDTDEAHDDIRAAIAAAMPSGSLSDEDEDDLQRELAAVAEDVVVLEDETPEVAEIVVEDTTAETETHDEPEADADVAAEASSDADEDDAASEDVADIPEVVQSRPKSRKKLPDADYAVTRMIAQTDEALNEPAGSRRRNAIAQLKAAVAATEAARQLGDDAGSAAEAENAFRDDLDQVVRPSRPVDPNDENDRPRAAPLKLVASQRVDGEDEAEAPARSKPKMVDAAEVGGFAQFAASMGATELPDLLEAAAAYTSFVEGVEDFSRPQIMKKVQMTTTEEFSREDGLRSFGTLLRQGRISKVRNGRFQVSDQTRFRPDARSA